MTVRPAAVEPCAIDVAALLGRGPGLTPSGDDVLAGYLLGCRAFGIAGKGVRFAVLRSAPGATTTLSAALLRQAADQGSAAAQDLLGTCCAAGRGVTRDEQEAVAWFRKAMAQGHPQAYYKLGVCYEFGSGVARD